MPSQASLTAFSMTLSTIPSAPKASNMPTAATLSASKTMTPNSVSTKHTPDYRRYGCSQCNRLFRADESLQQHYQASHRKQSSGVLGHICDTCKKSFLTRDARQNHQRAKKHYHCCSECKQTFELESSLVEHFDTVHTSHFRCCDCEQDFVSERALDQHLNDKVHQPVRCQVCGQELFSKSALDQHIVVEHHASRTLKRVYCLEHVHGCYICQRKFDKKVDLDQHLTSLKHRPLSDIACVASDKCKRRFGSPSALIQHLESGACCSGIDRHTVNKLVQDNDTGRIISNGPVAQSLLEYNQNPSQCSSSNGTPILTPTSSTSCSPVPTPITGYVFEQPMPFLSLDADISSSTTMLMALNLNSMDHSLPSIVPSDDHTPALFHCPGALVSTAPHRVSPRKFKTLSGLAQHIVSGACSDGPATLKKVIEFVQERLDNMGLGSIRLLK